jgi:hypothetical protein
VPAGFRKGSGKSTNARTLKAGSLTNA